MKLKISNMCLFENSFIHLDINDIQKGIFILGDLKKFNKNIKRCLELKNCFLPIIYNLITFYFKN